MNVNLRPVCYENPMQCIHLGGMSTDEDHDTKPMGRVTIGTAKPEIQSPLNCEFLGSCLSLDPRRKTHES